MPLNQDVQDTVKATNDTVNGNGPSFYLNLAMADAVAHQRRMNIMMEAAMAKILGGLSSMPAEKAMTLMQNLSNAPNAASQLGQLSQVYQNAPVAGPPSPASGAAGVVEKVVQAATVAAEVASHIPLI